MTRPVVGIIGNASVVHENYRVHPAGKRNI